MRNLIVFLLLLRLDVAKVLVTFILWEILAFAIILNHLNFRILHSFLSSYFEKLLLTFKIVFYEKRFYV